MQEEVEQKTFNIVVSTTKLTARTILNAGKAAIQQQQTKMAGGKQSVRMLLRQNRGVSSVEIDKTNIRGFERYAKKYGIDYAIRKDNSEMPPRYLVFFKAPDAEAFNSAFKEYSASLLNRDKRPSVPVSACGVLSICLRVMVTTTPAPMLMCGKEAKPRQRQPRLPLYRIRMEQ